MTATFFQTRTIGNQSRVTEHKSVTDAKGLQVGTIAPDFEAIDQDDTKIAAIEHRADY